MDKATPPSAVFRVPLSSVAPSIPTTTNTIKSNPRPTMPIQRHNTPLSLAALANIPSTTRRVADTYRESMDPLVQKDTSGVRWILSPTETKRFVQQLFSDQRIFGSGNTSIHSILNHLNVQGLWSSSTKQWLTYPDPEIAYSEENIARFFNRILDNLPDSILCERRWTGSGANKPLNGFSGAIRKPDLILCEKSVIEKCNIKKDRQFDLRTDVYAIGEVKKKNNTDNIRTSFIELAGKVVFQLETQDGRYAAPGIQVLGTEIVLVLFDRGGSVCTLPIDIHRHPKLFLRILLGITFGDGTVLGFDPTVSPVVNTKKQVRITKDRAEWTVSVDQLLFISASLHGRGTTVWSGTTADVDFPGGLKEGEVVVVKDTFVDPSRRYTEGKILKILEEHGIEGVPRLIHEQQVQTTHPLDPNLMTNQSTHILRSLIVDPLPEDCKYHLRVLSRLLSTPKGEPIFDFSSLAELIIGLVDCLEAHSDAFEKACVLHRDISLFNLLFVILASKDQRKIRFLQALRDDERTRIEEKIAAHVSRRGLLADWGYAIPVQKCADNVPSQEKSQSTIVSSPSSNPLGKPSLYVRSPGHSEAEKKSQNQLRGTDNIVIPLVDESLPDDPDAPIDASPLHRTGTWAWMAAELSYAVPGTPVIHQAYHDLESFFYIIVAICLLYDSPGTTKPPKTLADCFDPLFAVAHPSIAKMTIIQSDFGWTTTILPHISDYFQPLIPLLERLRTELILPIKLKDGAVQTNPNFTHRSFVAEMVKTLVQLPDTSWIPCIREKGAAVVEQSNSASITTLPPSSLSSIITTSAFLADDALSRRSPLRMLGTSSGSVGIKRPWDSDEDSSTARGPKRIH